MPGFTASDVASGNPMPGPNSAAYDLGLADQLSKNLSLEDEKRKQMLKEKMEQQGASALSSGILSPASMALFSSGGKY